MKITRPHLFALVCLLLIGGSLRLQAQDNANTPAPFLRYPTIPPFELKGLDGKTINRESLGNRKGTMIVYFSPDCHHCQEQVEWMKASYDQLKELNIVFATYQPLEDLNRFFKSYKLSDWKNLYIGRDEKFFLPPYFRIGDLPFIAVYDKKGKLLANFSGTTRVDKIAGAIN
jgi:cytochrome oxidase Cu insertion factor (SCO1/SenC/PrrC family)